MRTKASYSAIVTMLALLAGGGTLAACAYSHEPVIATRCNESGDHCWQVHCNEDGEDCYPMGYSDEHGASGYDRRYWVCDEDGDHCHRAYGAPPASGR